MTGSEFYKLIEKLEGPAREAEILRIFSEGHLPGWLVRQSWRPVSVEADVGKAVRRLTYFVSPDYFSIGTDADFLRTPARPATYQTIASSLAAIMPSRRMVNAIWGSADARVEPVPIPGASDRRDSAPFLQSNEIINKQLQSMGRSPLWNLVAGDKKDVVIGPGLDGSKVAIYGWHQSSGKPWQPYPGPHTVDHVDYSHGGRFVSRAAFLDGSPVDIASIFIDKQLSVLVSDQGPFLPFFPNTGAQSAVSAEKLQAIIDNTVALRSSEAFSEKPTDDEWGTLEWLTAVAASLGIVGFGIEMFRRR